MADVSYLPWFLGPKAENADFLENILLLVTRDYVHWRRNYFPSDKALSTKALARRQLDAYDQFESEVAEVSAELRRNFPFYSPRYIGHQLSDVSLPAIIGTIAGLLYNANNVTPEAAPVTVEWEIDACNKVLEMIGFTPPPNPPLTPKEDEVYERKLRAEFGWAHITSGGTVANLEALWVARATTYFPLAIQEAAEEAGIELLIKLPSHADDEDLSIHEVTRHQLTLLKPNESIYLLSRFIDKLRRDKGISVKEASKLATKLISASQYSPGSGFFRAAAEFRPVILTSGAAHYSIAKSANILGIGSDNVLRVDLDSMFRISIPDLERKIRAIVEERGVPIAVVPIAGTTEEGSVDPIHRIVDLRKSLEEEDISFWIHIDAAWAGYFRSLFTIPRTEVTRAVLQRVGETVGIAHEGDTGEWHHRVLQHVRGARADGPPTEVDELKVQQRAEWLTRLYDEQAPEKYFRALFRTLRESRTTDSLRRSDLKPMLRDRISVVQDFVSDRLALEHGAYMKRVDIRYGAEEVCSAFLAFSFADSITVDPHKMGYTGYPCGIVAYRNDRMRHLIMQDAPYITAASHNALIHDPPRHLSRETRGDTLDRRSSISAFAPFILEGSRPGFAAVSLWLSTRLIPLNIRGHGELVKASVLAARELYEWIVRWDKICRHNGVDNDFEVVPYTSYPPDTNLVIFAVKKKTSGSLNQMNALTNAVYERFTILAEHGERQYSYSQPFFLSKTPFKLPNYNFSALASFFKRCGIRGARRAYESGEAVVLRASVMNPYITPLRVRGTQQVLREFMLELSRTATEAVKRIH